MACCNNIEPTRLGCYACDEEIIAETAMLSGEYAFELHFRGAIKRVNISYVMGEEIDLNAIFDFEFTAPYDYELILTRPDLSEAKYCFTMKMPVVC